MSCPRFFSLLRDLQIPSHVYNLLRSYVEDREVQIRIPECIIRKKINRGCPQGSILGSILWNTYLDNLLDLLDKEESITDFSTYADDLQPYKRKQPQGIRNQSNHSSKNPQLVPKIQDDDVAY
ncbi:hypothetical protein HN011_010505 [Eciton burchellii]|nr:hypothetical protein HN011_010505 [Eciton burchellii]